MTDWSALNHAYGSAEDVPPLLEKLESQPREELWSELWSMLCHQGTTYSASLAALPWLARTASSSDRSQAVNAVVLAASIIEVEDALEDYAAPVASLRGDSERLLHATRDDRLEYAYLMAAMLAVEGEVGWNDNLPEALDGGELAGACPHCEADLIMELNEDGFFCTAPDHSDEATPLRASSPDALVGLGRRLHDTALADNQHEVAGLLTFLFGRATCLGCGEEFAVPDAL